MRDQADRIRITRDLTLCATAFGEHETVKVRAGLVLNGPATITEEGAALIGLAYDEPVHIPVGAWEVAE